MNLLADGKKVNSTTTDASKKWAWSFSDLPVYEGGEKIVYTVTEDAVEGYSTEIDGYSITNTLLTSVSGTKTWVDADGRDGQRPESVTVYLYANDEQVKQTTATAESKWKYSFENLAKYDASGNEIKYTVKEKTVDGYSSKVDGYNITNTQLTSVSVTKTWYDGNSASRPDSIMVYLYANNEVKTYVSVSAKENWTYSFTGLPKYDENSNEIKYTVKEDAVEGYSSKVDGYNITNTLLTDIYVTKTWNDAENQDGKRPASITVKLMAVKTADGTAEEVQSATISPDESGNWAYTFTGLDKFNGEFEIKYRVEEAEVTDYTTEISGDAATVFTIKNSHTPEVTDITVTKIWNDDNNQDGIRPESITVTLVKNGTPTTQTVELKKAEDWAPKSFVNLPVYEKGEKITYTVQEEVPTGYTASYDGTTITNSHTSGKIGIQVTKNWNDNEDQDGIRPESVEVMLLADGTDTGKRVTLNAANSWSASFTELAEKKDGGTVIKYTVEEVGTVEGYTSVVSGDMSKGFTITNTHVPETIEISGTKTWDDADDQDGKRPDSITVNLMAVKTQGGAKEFVTKATVTADKDGVWSYSFTNLARYNKGFEIQYSVEEAEVTYYTTEIKGYDITNKHVPETIEISGTKTWDDADDQDGKRPTSITVNLMAVKTQGGAKEFVTKATVTADKDGVWSYSFTNLARYNKGFEIQYSVEEAEVTYYTTEIKGYDITNKHVPETIDISGTKTWDDADDQDGKRPDSITVNLMAVKSEGGAKEFVTKATVTADKDGVWSYSFTNLARYNKGFEIQYSVEETEVTDYTTEINGYNITNAHTPETIDISGSKTWNDANDQDGKRPDSITIRLFADGKETGKMVVTETDGWKWSFTELPKFANGKEIVYTITEDAVEGYTSTVKDYDVTNSYTPGKVSVYVTKSWQDGGNLDGIRPNVVTIKLLADGKDTGKVLTLNAECSWTGCFADLDEYQNGQKIVYTIEENWVFGYSRVITGDMTTGFVVTNCHTPVRLRTGDDSDLALWSALAGLSATGLAGAVVATRRKKRKDGGAE